MKLPRIGKKRFLLYVSIAAVLSVVAVTLAWFAANRLVESNDMGMAASGNRVKVEYKVVTDNPETDQYVEMNPGTAITLDNRIEYPGDTQEYKIRITNTGKDPVKLASFGISKPTDAEEAANKEGYYFGTQILVQLVGVSNGTLPADAAAQYLAEYNESGSETSDTPKALKTLTEIELWKDQVLGVNESVELTVRFTFENKNESQNEYISFGSEEIGGTCKRRFYIRFDLGTENSNSQS